MRNVPHFRHSRRRSRAYNRNLRELLPFVKRCQLDATFARRILVGYAFVKISRLLNMQIMESTESHGLQEGASVKSSLGNRSRS
jgi:hypothetical protein